MGGYGSSRWGMTLTRLTTDGLPRLDVRGLARDGGLAPGTSATITWHDEDPVPATITTHVPADEPDTLVLAYRILTDTGSEMSVHERIGPETTACHYGGVRAWFRCPGCHRRRAVLFGLDGWFRCRACHRLAYASTRDRCH